MEKAPLDDGTMFSFDDFFGNMANVDMLDCWEANLQMSCEPLKDKNVYRQASSMVKVFVSLFVSYTGHEIANGYPLCKSSAKNNNAFVRMCMKMIDIVQQSVIAMGPDALSNDIKITLFVFYAYVCAIEKGQTMNDIHCVLGMLSVEFSNAIDGVNFCVSHLYDYNHVYGPNPYCFVKNLTIPGSKRFEKRDYQFFNVHEKVYSLFNQVRALKKEEKLKAKNEAIALKRRKAAEEAELRRKKKRRQKAAKLERKKEEKMKAKNVAIGWERRKAAEEAELKRKKKRPYSCKKKQDHWEKTKQSREEKKRLYRKAELEKAKVEEEQRQREIEAYHRLLLERYYEKVRKEQDQRRLMRNVIKQAHVLSPSRKREEKIRRRQQQEDTHAVWREQKRKQKDRKAK